MLNYLKKMPLSLNEIYIVINCGFAAFLIVYSYNYCYCSFVISLQEVNANSDNLNDAQKRLVDFYLYNLKISGFLMSTNDRRKYYDKVGRRNTHTHNFA